MDNLKCKMQAHARVYKENIEFEEKNDAYWNNFVVKGTSLKDHMGRVERSIKTIFSRMIHHRIKVLAIIIMLSVIACVARLLAIVMETSAKTCGLAGS